MGGGGIRSCFNKTNIPIWYWPWSCRIPNISIKNYFWPISRSKQRHGSACPPPTIKEYFIPIQLGFLTIVERAEWRAWGGRWGPHPQSDQVDLAVVQEVLIQYLSGIFWAFRGTLPIPPPPIQLGLNKNTLKSKYYPEEA